MPLVCFGTPKIQTENWPITPIGMSWNLHSGRNVLMSSEKPIFRVVQSTIGILIDEAEQDHKPLNFTCFGLINQEISRKSF